MKILNTLKILRSTVIAILLALFVSSTTIGQVGSNYKILMYVTSWSGSSASYDYSKVTHLNYSFAVPSADGTVPAPENAAKLQDIVSRAHAAGVKVCLAIGGWMNSSPTGTPFETFSQTATGRANFANACANFIQQYNLDGIDIDWEYPQSQQRWNDLIAAVRQAIGSNKLLTAAVAGSDWFGQGFGSASFSNLDFINIMAYDCSCPTNAPYNFAVSALQYWIGRGMPANKCVLGVPFYNNDNTAALHTQKANYVKSISAAGMMAWELANDADGSQLNAIYTALKGGNVGYPPVANANGPYSAKVGASINFSSAGSNDPDGSIVSYLWNFGDGSTSASANPSHAYSSKNNYTVTLTATDNNGKTGTNSTTATITEDGSGDCDAPQYVAGGNYATGSNVSNYGTEYNCKVGGWCSSTAAWAYEPGTGLYWQDAWIAVGPCNSTNPVLSSLSISPLNPSIKQNSSQQFSSQGYDQNGNPMSATISWSATGGSISNTGLYQGTTIGTFTVRATSGAISVSTSVSVTSGGGLCSAPEWNSAQVYVKDNIVSYNNHEWKAKWWTQNEMPGTTGEWGVWLDLGACSTLKSTSVGNSAISVEVNDVSDKLTVYPNPFTVELNFKFNLTEENLVTLKIYNGIGAEVATLINKRLSEGNHSATLNGSDLKPGFYLYRLTINNSSQMGRIIKK